MDVSFLPGLAELAKAVKIAGKALDAGHSLEGLLATAANDRERFAAVIAYHERNPAAARAEAETLDTVLIEREYYAATAPVPQWCALAYIGLGLFVDRVLAEAKKGALTNENPGA